MIEIRPGQVRRVGGVPVYELQEETDG